MAAPAAAQAGAAPGSGSRATGAIPGFAAPSWTEPVSPEPGSRFEARFGAFAQSASGTATSGALSGEIVTPRLPFGLPGAWSVLTPRLHGGVIGNLGGDASAAYGGFLWTIPLHQRLFAEAFVGGAVRDRMTPGGGRATFGCGPSLNSGGSIGYRFSDRWSLLLTYDRIADGTGPAGSGCAPGTAVNNYGARLGVAF